MNDFVTTPANDEGVARIAVPSKGRLRDECLKLLSTAGYRISGLRGAGSMTRTGDLELIEMRPRDAAAALSAGALDGAFIATDIAMEYDLGEGFECRKLGYSRSTLVVAGRDDDGRQNAKDLEGGVVATHMPNLTRRFFDEQGIDVRVVGMGGSLEGVCAAGLADAIVDNTETGTSLRQNRLRVLAEIRDCEAEFMHRRGMTVLEDLDLRMEAALSARKHRYVMLHIPKDKIDGLVDMFHGLEAPTVLPLAHRDDLAAVHFVAKNGELWAKLAELRELGATDIVATQPVALLE